MMITNSWSIRPRSSILIRQSAARCAQYQCLISFQEVDADFLSSQVLIDFHRTALISFRSSLREVTLEVCVSGRIWSFRRNKSSLRATASAGALWLQSAEVLLEVSHARWPGANVSIEEHAHDTTAHRAVNVCTLKHILMLYGRKMQ